MNRELIWLVKFVMLMLSTFFVVVLLMTSPFMYLEGSAKSEWLKQTRNIDIPWYKAVFLNVNTQDINDTIK